jgi:prefoldin beta subunit
MAEDDMNQLQMIEQNLQSMLMQKQQFQAQLMEIESAEKELAVATSSYKIVGNIMVLSSKEDLIKDLSQKREMLEMRLKAIEKQESRLREKAQSIQKDVLSKMKEDGKD